MPPRPPRRHCSEPRFSVTRGGRRLTPAGSNSADAPDQPTLPPRWQLHDLDVVDSTNAVARALGEEGAAEGQVVWASEQRGGRARRGRGWH